MCKFQCAICLAALHLNEISALHCGHTFHLQCILQWLDNCKSCPVCRKRATARDHIAQLFFQTEEDNTDGSRNDLTTLQDKLNKALQELREERSRSNLRVSSYLLLGRQNEALMEKVKTMEGAARIRDEQLKGLEGMLVEQQYMEKELKVCRKRLQASEFYKLLTSVNEDPLEEIDKYISDSGLEVEKFVVLLRKQLKGATKSMEKQKEELHRYQRKISELQKKLDDHKKLNVALKKELASTRTDLSQTIMNPALVDVIAYSFLEKVSSSSELKLVDVDDMEEVFVPPAVRKYAVTSGLSSVMHETASWKRKQVAKSAEQMPPQKKATAASKNAIQSGNTPYISNFFGKPAILDDTITID